MQLIRQFLERKKLTQEEFAEQVGVSQGVISHWLSSKKRPSLDNLLSMSAVTSIPIEKLIADLQTDVPTRDRVA
jgi:transcriptional regulator with XRE-family HTH domain